MLSDIECRQGIIELIVHGANKEQIRSKMSEKLAESGLCLEFARAFVEQQLEIITKNVIL